MLPNQSSLERFSAKLPEFCNSEPIEIEKLATKTEANWDSPARLVAIQFHKECLTFNGNDDAYEQVDVTDDGCLC